jgi:hypothetical protein
MSSVEESAVERRMLDRREIAYLRDEVIALNREAKIIALKVSNISTTLRVAIGFLMGSVAIALWIIQDTKSAVTNLDLITRTRHEITMGKVIDADLRRLKQDNAIAAVQAIISINQKRVMAELKLPYMAPESARGYE